MFLSNCLRNNPINTPNLLNFTVLLYYPKMFNIENNKYRRDLILSTSRLVCVGPKTEDHLSLGHDKPSVSFRLRVSQISTGLLENIYMSRWSFEIMGFKIDYDSEERRKEEGLSDLYLLVLPEKFYRIKRVSITSRYHPDTSNL